MNLPYWYSILARKLVSHEVFDHWWHCRATLTWLTSKGMERETFPHKEKQIFAYYHFCCLCSHQKFSISFTFPSNKLNIYGVQESRLPVQSDLLPGNGFLKPPLTFLIIKDKHSFNKKPSLSAYSRLKLFCLAKGV